MEKPKISVKDTCIVSKSLKLNQSWVKNKYKMITQTVQVIFLYTNYRNVTSSLDVVVSVTIIIRISVSNHELEKGFHINTLYEKKDPFM